MEREDSQEPPRITGGKPIARAVSDSSAIRRRNSHIGPKYITLGFKDSSPIYNNALYVIYIYIMRICTYNVYIYIYIYK
jgi:hypothetical protein